MLVRTFSVTVHSCLLEFETIPESRLIPGYRYVIWANGYRQLSGRVNESYEFKPTCRCKKQATLKEANDLVENGRAQWIYHLKNKRLIEDDKKIWMSQQRQVPRIDLISKADIERAYVDNNPTYQKYIEECNKLILDFRAQLIVPFRDDPTEGQLLFPFTADQRTGK